MKMAKEKKKGRKALKIIICIIGYVGIETASISAVVASIGVGISLAVQGTLSNFAGGVIIIIMRPFKIGDYIETKEESENKVEEEILIVNIALWILSGTIFGIIWRYGIIKNINKTE